MYFNSFCDYGKSRPANTGGRRPSSRYAARLRVEALEGRAVPAVIADPAGDFLSTYTGTQDPGLDVFAHIVNGRTVAATAFAGPDIVGGSLPDENYTLSIRSDLVHNAFRRSLDGGANGAAGGDHTDAFFRLYGDSDGDRDVDLRDLVRFLGTLGQQEVDRRYLWYSDVNSDGRVDVIDVIAFARRLESRLES
jgi:hypothetical protein